MHSKDKPDLSLSTLSQLEDELSEMDRDLWRELRDFLVPKGMETVITPGPRPPKRSATFYLILSNYSGEWFYREASKYPRYPPDRHFPRWLLKLSQRIINHTIALVKEIEASNPEMSFAYHGVNEDEMGRHVWESLKQQMSMYHEVKFLPPKLPTSAPPPPPPPPHVQQQMAAYAASGVDVASEAPLLKTAMRTEHSTQLPVRAEVKPPRVPRSIQSKTAAEKMEQYREKIGLDQTQFAGKLKVDPKTLYRFRRTGKVDKSIAAKIAEEMGTKVEDLLKP